MNAVIPERLAEIEKRLFAPGPPKEVKTPCKTVRKNGWVTVLDADDKLILSASEPVFDDIIQYYK